jgi:PAS domain S-box-containing protein
VEGGATSVRFPTAAKALFGVGAVVFLSSLYPNHVLNSEIAGDVLEFFGTTGIVVGAFLAFRSQSVSVVAGRLFVVGGVFLMVARFLDMSEEFAVFVSVPVLGRAGMAHGILMSLTEAAGYTIILLSLTVGILELAGLKKSAEEQQSRYQALHEQSRLLARVADMSAEAVIGADREGIIRTWNVGAQRLFGYRPPEATGSPLDKVLVDVFERTDMDLTAHVAEVGPLHEVEVLARRRDGACFQAGASLSPVFDDDAKPIGVSVIVRDIEERKKAERELIASRNLLEGALQNAHVGMFIVRRDFSIAQFNALIEELTGVSWAGLGSIESLAEKRFDPSAGFVDTVRNLVFEDGVAAEFRHMAIRHQDGTMRFCDLGVAPVWGESGAVEAAAGIAVDITAREVLQAKLLESQKLESVGRLAGGIAHDFNNILGGVLGFASLLRQRLDPESPCLRYAESIQESATRASELTHQLLTFARGGAVLPEILDLNSLVDETLALVSHTLDPNIVLEFHPVEDLSAIRADASQIQQICMNLVINARDALDGRGAISVTTANVVVDEGLKDQLRLGRPGPFVRLVVTDDGCGMSPEVCQRIFEPFFSTKKEQGGYGLGLSVVYGIVEAHRGGLLVQSEVGKGTRIEVYFPATDEKAEERRKELVPIQTAFHGNETVMVVDDESLIRTLVADILSRDGYTVLEAESGDKALELFQSNKEGIDLIVLDLIMPGMSGVATLEALRSISPDLRCIFSSGHGTDGIDAEYLSDKRISLVAKPYQADDLAVQVRHLLDA